MNIKRLTILTIILHFFIIIAAGHGIACIGLSEIIGLRYFYGIGGENFSFSLIAEYEKSLGASALFAFIGHLVLLYRFILKTIIKNIAQELPGLFFYWFRFIM
ncbi:MAG: hypothetical protein WDM90_02630 [Ferruginibacter sp.]